MFIARWVVDAKFGHKDAALGLCRRWMDEVGARIGLKASRTLNGSIGASESRLEFESTFQSLAQLEKAWDEMSKMPAHRQFGRDLEPHIVSGSNRWEVLRVSES